MNHFMVLMVKQWFVPVFTLLFFTGFLSSLFYVAEVYLSIALPVLRTIKCIKYLTTRTRRRRVDPTLVPENLLCYWVIYAILQLFPWQHFPYAKQFRFILFAGLQLALFEGQYGYVIVYQYLLEPHLQMYEGVINQVLQVTDKITHLAETSIGQLVHRVF